MPRTQAQISSVFYSSHIRRSFSSVPSTVLFPLPALRTPTRLPPPSPRRFSSSPTSSPSTPHPTPIFSPLSSFPPLSTLHLVYAHDRSRFFRRLSLLSLASLVLLWTPLSYVSLFVASPPLYTALIGPLATLAILLATHHRASRTVHSIHLTTPNTALITTHTALGPLSATTVPLLSLTPPPPSTSTAALGTGYWPIQIAGLPRFFLLDKQGTTHDRTTMRRIVGDQPELEGGDERDARVQQGVKGPPTLKGNRRQRR